MPTYCFKDKKGNIQTEFMSISELDPFILAHPELELMPSMPAIVSGVNLKPASGFRDLLSRIKKNSPGGKVNDFGGGGEV